MNLEANADVIPEAITVRGLRRSYGTGAGAFEAVRGVDLTIRAGTIHALLGVNGAGKTSTMEVIEGLARPSAGEVRVLGMDPVADRAAVRRRTGVLLQRSGFVDDLTVTETLQMWAATVTAARPVTESLEELDLVERADTRMRALSGGETRRVDLACTLMGRPDVVMLDEPTTGLDPESRRAVWQLVRRLREDGATVLLTTHYLEEAEALADHLSIMRAGKIVRSGTPAQIVTGHASEISYRTPDHEPLAWAETSGVRLDKLAAHTASLESVFLEIADDHHDLDPGSDPHTDRLMEGSDR